MNTKFLWVVIPSLLLVVFITFVVATTNSGTSSAYATSSPKSMNNGVAPSKLLGAKAVSGSASTSATNITLSEVQAYVKTHGFPSGPSIVRATPKVVAIELLTSKEASQRMQGEPTGLANTAYVYYVVWHGPFNLQDVGGPVRTSLSKSAASVLTTGHEVFDAQTGNLLVWGIDA